jgi:hypothetical protein
MTANRTAQKPMMDVRLFGECQHPSLNVLALHADKRRNGHVGSHFDEKIWTHDDQPLFFAL